MPRYSIDLTDDEAQEVKAIAKDEDRTVASALRCLVRRQLHVGKLLDNGVIRLESAPICVESAENPQRHSPARAPVRDDQQSIESSISEDGPEQAITGLLESLKWYGAKLANGTTPSEFASNLLEAFPGADIGAELHKASAWLGQAPSRRKKHLGKFLLGWMGRINKGPKQSSFTPQKQSDQQDYTKGVDENGNW